MSKKKKVAILLPWLKMGGTNKIALHFMKELSQYCDVTLILSEHTGELISQLPEISPILKTSPISRLTQTPGFRVHYLA